MPSKALLLIVVIGLAGCTDYDLNKQHERNTAILNEAKRCTDAGLEARPIETADTGIILAIQCRPKGAR